MYQTGYENLGIVHQSADQVVSIALIEQNGSNNVGYINQ